MREVLCSYSLKKDFFFKKKGEVADVNNND